MLALLIAAAAAVGWAAGPAVIAPPANGVFDYQIGGAYTPAPDVTIVDRDRSDPPAAGKYGICYINGFQAQTSELSWWKRHHKSLLLKRNGKFVVDRGWNEVLLDTSTPSKRASLLGVIGPWLDRCAKVGYRAVEPDNLDSWSRSQGRLNPSENLAFARLLADRAHADGLAIGQKNASEVAKEGRQTVGFDFVIAEECQRYTGSSGGRECEDYRRWYANNVFEIEYTDGGGRPNFAAACAARGSQVSITYRDRDVKPRGTTGYAFDHC